MKVKDIVSEAVMSVSVQAKFPVSAGVRSLMGSRWRYDLPMKASQKNVMIGAVDQLEYYLKHVNEFKEESIKQVVVHTGETFRILPEELHGEFRKKFGVSPVDYAIRHRKYREGRPVNL